MNVFCNGHVSRFIREKKLRLVIVGSTTIDCRNGQTDPMSEAFLQMAGVFSQLELAMIRARVKSGMANAAARGRKIGRPQTTKEDIPTMLYKHYPAFVAGTMNLTELARVCGLSRPTVYKYLKIIKKSECIVNLPIFSTSRNMPTEQMQERHHWIKHKTDTPGLPVCLLQLQW